MNESSSGTIGGGFYWGSWPQGQYGWICPKCNKGISPNVTYCPCNDWTYTNQGGSGSIG